MPNLCLKHYAGKSESSRVKPPLGKWDLELGSLCSWVSDLTEALGLTQGRTALFLPPLTSLCFLTSYNLGTCT